jgi:hypothetical protein
LKQTAANHHKINALGRFILSVFVVAWLNLAVQPCLMATELAPEPEPATAHSVHSAQSAHSSHSDGHDCGHCPGAVNHDHQACASSAASTCGATPDYNYDARNQLLKLKDISTYVAIADPVPRLEFDLRNEPVQSSRCADLSWPDEPPLNLRYCVFLK